MLLPSRTDAHFSCYAESSGKFMALPTTLIPALFSLGAVCTWGTSDFLGGYGARRTNALLLTTIAHAAGTTFMLMCAFGTHAVFPSNHAVIWSCAAGLSGGGALALFYKSLSSGNMGLTAPVAAVFSAAIPVAIGVTHEGFPGIAPASGFLLAAIGIWLVSRTEDGQRPKGIGMALIAGAGFAGYYLCTRQAGPGSAFWIAALARGCIFHHYFHHCFALAQLQTDEWLGRENRYSRRMYRRHRQRLLHSRGAIWKARLDRCTQFALSGCYGAPGTHRSARTLHPLASCGHDRCPARGSAHCTLTLV